MAKEIKERDEKDKIQRTRLPDSEEEEQGERCVPTAALHPPGSKVKLRAERLAIRASTCLREWH